MFNILEHEFVIAEHLDQKGVMCHASHLLSLLDGGLLCVYFGGTAEKDNDVRIWAARRSPEGVWEAPYPITEDDGIAHWNPVLMRKADGSIALFYKVGREIPQWQTLVRFSNNEGQDFGEARELVPGDVGGRGPVRNKVIRLQDGRLAAPASLENGHWVSFIDFSTDDGDNWHAGPVISLPDNQFPAIPQKKRGIIQPTLWESPPGHLHALMRSSENAIFRSDSADNGQTWSPPYNTGLPNNNSGIDLAQLSDERLVLIMNPVAKNWGPRSPISVFVSKDNGDTWSLLSNLETAPGEYSYPVILAQELQVRITYTWNRKNIAYWRLQF